MALNSLLKQLEDAAEAAHPGWKAALKPGLLFPPGSRLAGELELVDIGLDPENDGPGGDGVRTNLVQRSDVAAWWPRRLADAHKWHAALRIIAGSRTMTGAAALYPIHEN